MPIQAQTHRVTDDAFRQVYDSPVALPRRFKWLTTDEDVRQIEVYSREMIARTKLSERKFINTEAPRIFAGLRRFQCGAPLDALRSFRCHNWVYAMPVPLKMLQAMKRQENPK